MAFFDVLGQKITKTGQGAMNKAQSMADSVKLSSAVSDEEKKITEYYRQIGELYYANYGAAPAPEFSALCRQVADAKAQIQTYQQQLHQLKGQAPCPNCGRPVSLSAMFCSNCGQSLQKQEPVQQANGKVCPSCGRPVAQDDLFCIACGARLDSSPTDKPVDEEAAEIYNAAPEKEEAVEVCEAEPVQDEAEAEMAASESVEKAPAQDEAEPAVQPAVKICPNCGRQLDASVRFCVKCGTRLEE